MEGRVLTCVYCGHEYPQDTPSWGNEVLTQHIKICKKHPMREKESKITALHSALEKIVSRTDSYTDDSGSPEDRLIHELRNIAVKALEPNSKGESREP